VIEHVPGVTNIAVVSETVQTVGEFEVNVTVRPELAVALSVNRSFRIPCAAIAPNVIVCDCCVLGLIAVTSVALAVPIGLPRRRAAENSPKGLIGPLYTAANGNLSAEAWALAAILFVWHFPRSFAIDERRFGRLCRGATNKHAGCFQATITLGESPSALVWR